MRVVDSKETLKEKKLRLEKELKKVKTQLANEDKVGYARDLVESKLKEVQEVFPTLDMEVGYNEFTNEFYMDEPTLNSADLSYRHTVDLGNVDDSLNFLNDLLVNPEKYHERYRFAVELGTKVRLKEFYLVSGIFSYNIIEKIESSGVEQRVRVRGVFDKENKINIDVLILHALEDNFTDECTVTLEGIDFTMETCIEAFDGLDVYDAYSCSVEGIGFMELLKMIERMKVATRNHSAVVKIVEGK